MRGQEAPPTGTQGREKKEEADKRSTPKKKLAEAARADQRSGGQGARLLRTAMTASALRPG